MSIQARSKLSLKVPLNRMQLCLEKTCHVTSRLDSSRKCWVNISSYLPIWTLRSVGSFWTVLLFSKGAMMNTLACWVCSDVFQLHAAYTPAGSLIAPSALASIPLPPLATSPPAIQQLRVELATEHESIVYRPVSTLAEIQGEGVANPSRGAGGSGFEINDSGYWYQPAP